MGKLRDWLQGDGDRPRWSMLQYAVAACAEGLQDELRDEWNEAQRHTANRDAFQRRGAQ